MIEYFARRRSTFSQASFMDRSAEIVWFVFYREPAHISREGDEYMTAVDLYIEKCGIRMQDGCFIELSRIFRRQKWSEGRMYIGR
jgi:hypothetical protein